MSIINNVFRIEGIDRIRTFCGHPFHVMGVNPLPFWISWVIFFAIGDIICLLKVANTAWFHHWVWAILFFVIIYSWFQEMSFEGAFGWHTLQVQSGLRLGIIFFIVSEAMLFISFFWAFFNASLNPAVFIGACWPPRGVEYIEALGLPFLNTLILLSSGLTLTIAHSAVNNLDLAQRAIYFSSFLKLFQPTNSSKSKLFNIYTTIASTFTSKAPISQWRFWVLDTVLRGFLFIFFQLIEYSTATFTIMDSAYGSAFYALTGLHGLHVFIGATGLLFCAFENTFSTNIEKSYIFASKDSLEVTPAYNFSHYFFGHRVAFEGLVWYWHFVDVVWLLLFVVVYWWGII